MKQPNIEMLIGYLLNEVNAEEQAFVTAWLASDERNLQSFQAFEKIWLLSQFTDSTNIINLDAEWNIFKKNVAEGNSEPLQTSQSAVYQLHNKTSIERRKIRRIFIAVTVAASIIAVIFMGKFLFTNQAVKTNIAGINKPKNSPALVLRHEINTTGKPKKIQLQDGTIILLDDKSELSFTEPFAANYRSVTLIGKANFKVAKDKTRPFTVYSDAIATTVLGTVFDVSAYPQANTILVRLYEGKVVANSAPTSIKKLQKAIYLSPGYEMIYNKQNAVANVRPFNVLKTDSSKQIIAPSNIDKLNIPAKKGSWFMFNNQPLSQVFNQLKEMYKVEIQYSDVDIQKLYFIGQFNKEDSIETILEQIAKPNNLLVTKSNNIFIIHK